MKTVCMVLAAFLLAAALPFGALAEASTPEFGAITGTVTDVAIQMTDGVMIAVLSIDYGDGARAVLLTDGDTYWASGESAAVGDAVTGFYDATRPMTMIYPPRYAVVALAVNPPADETIRVDRFSGDPLVSSDGALQLNLSGGPEILSRDGGAYAGPLDGAVLAVYYAKTTRSIPAQTSPRRIVVVSEPEAGYAEVFDLTGAPIHVEGKKIESPDAFWSGGNAVMVAVKPVADALGMDYTFDEATGLVTVNKISFTVGRDGYAVGRMAPAMLGEAPVLKDGYVYVPLNFFTEAAGLNNACFFEGQIDIDNFEKMG